MKKQFKHDHVIIERPLQQARGRKKNGAKKPFIYGLADIYGKIIEVDPRQPPDQWMETVIHEKFHLLFPDMSEANVYKNAKAIAKMLWDLDYRRVDQQPKKRGK